VLSNRVLASSCYFHSMKWRLFLFLLQLELGPLQAQSPSSNQSKAKVALHSQVSQIGNDCPSAKATMEENSCISMAGNKQNATSQPSTEVFAHCYGKVLKPGANWIAHRKTGSITPRRHVTL